MKRDSGTQQRRFGGWGERVCVRQGVSRSEGVCRESILCGVGVLSCVFRYIQESERIAGGRHGELQINHYKLFYLFVKMAVIIVS